MIRERENGNGQFISPNKQFKLHLKLASPTINAEMLSVREKSIHIPREQSTDTWEDFSVYEQ
jgi:hypothetical protein